MLSRKSSGLSRSAEITGAMFNLVRVIIGISRHRGSGLCRNGIIPSIPKRDNPNQNYGAVACGGEFRDVRQRP
jgi:hypothetical protein